MMNRREEEIGLKIIGRVMRILEEVLEIGEHQEMKLKEVHGHYLIKKFLDNQIIYLLKILLPLLKKQQDHL